MIKELKTLHSGEPACQKRSDGDHLRFMVYRKRNEFKFEFSIELNGIKSWVVPDAPSMNPLDQRPAEEEEPEIDDINSLSLAAHAESSFTDKVMRSWDKGNYIPIDDDGNVLSEYEAFKCLQQGSLKFFLQGKRLVGEFVLLKRGKMNWLLMKRHDEFALYNQHSYEWQEQ